MKKEVSKTIRSTRYRIYPNETQAARLVEVLGLHQQLYNAALQERTGAWKKGIGISLNHQHKESAVLRAEDPDYAALDAQSMEMTLRRLDNAFQAFFRRVKAGQIPGYPRYKNKDRFDSFILRQSGWKLPSKKLSLSGIGKMRRKGSTKWEYGRPKTCAVKRENNKWYCIVAFEVEENIITRQHGNQPVSFDWGLTTFLTTVSQDGQVGQVEPPRYLKQAETKLKQAQRKLSSKKRGSSRRRKAKTRLTKLHNRVSNQREDFLHKTSACLISQSSTIITEKLNVVSMIEGGTKSLSRSISDSSPGQFIQMLKYKAEEAGIEFVELDTKKLKPTQTCVQCGVQVKKDLKTRQHSCECGLQLGRDLNSCLVMMKVFMVGENWIQFRPTRLPGQPWEYGLEQAKAEPCSAQPH